MSKADYYKNMKNDNNWMGIKIVELEEENKSLKQQLESWKYAYAHLVEIRDSIVDERNELLKRVEQLEKCYRATFSSLAKWIARYYSKQDKRLGFNDEKE